MDSFHVGIFSLVLLLFLLFLRFHVGVALSLAGFIGIAMIRGTRSALNALGQLPYEFLASWTLSAVPLFILLGAVAHHGGLTGSLYAAARNWLSFLPGNLAIATNTAGAGFAAVSGSSLASAAAIGRMAIPEMLAAGYNPGLATAVVAASGTLGSLIPPSILLIVYGMFTEQPIGKLLLAGFIPGLLTWFVYNVMIVLRCTISPELSPNPLVAISWADRWRTLYSVWPVPVLFLSVVATIYAGIATATEAAAIGAIVAYLIVILKGRMTKAVFVESLKETVVMTASIFFIAMGAVLLSRLLLFSGIPAWLVSMVNAQTTSLYVFMMYMAVLYLILGMFLDPIGLMLITLPVLFPLFKAMDINLIWMGIIVIKFLEISLLTPPVGLNVYVVKNVIGDRVRLETIFRGVVWFLLAEVVIVYLLIRFPEISLWLPERSEV